MFLGTGADLLCSLTNLLCLMAAPWPQQAAPMAAPCKTLGWKLPIPQAFHAPDRFSHASHSGTSSSTNGLWPGKIKRTAIRGCWTWTWVQFLLWQMSSSSQLPSEGSGHFRDLELQHSCLPAASTTKCPFLQLSLQFFCSFCNYSLQRSRKRSSEHSGKHTCSVAAGQSSAHVLLKPLIFKQWFCPWQRAKRGATWQNDCLLTY